MQEIILWAIPFLKFWGIFQILKIKNYFKQFMVGNPRIQEAEAGG